MYIFILQLSRNLYSLIECYIENTENNENNEIENNESNEKCTFPFTYNDVQYHTCINHNFDRPWCYTKNDNENKKPCKPDCPGNFNSTFYLDIFKKDSKIAR